jgi:hypothetical protein
MEVNIKDLTPAQRQALRVGRLLAGQDARVRCGSDERREEGLIGFFDTGAPKPAALIHFAPMGEVEDVELLMPDHSICLGRRELGRVDDAVIMDQRRPLEVVGR